MAVPGCMPTAARERARASGQRRKRACVEHVCVEQVTMRARARVGGRARRRVVRERVCA